MRTSDQRSAPLLQKLPHAPAYLSLVAVAEWRRVGGLLVEQKILSVVDVPVLAVYCVEYAKWRQAEELAQAAPMVETRPSGRERPSMAWKIASQAADLLHLCAVQLGLTPASRAKLR